MFGTIFKDKPDVDFNQIPNRELQTKLSYYQNPSNTKPKTFSAPFKFS